MDNNELTKRLQQAQERLQKRIQASGWAQQEKPAESAPACHTCHGQGWLMRNIQDVHEPGFGQLDPCPDCDLGRNQAAKRSGLSPSESGLDLDDLLVIKGTQLAKVKESVKNLLALGSGWIYFHGTHGLAKTQILKVATASWARSGRAGHYITATRLLDLLRASYDQDRPAEALLALVERWSAMPFLALDEIEKIHGTSWAADRLYDILNHRYELATRVESGITMMAGNLAPGQLDDHALASRIQDERFQVIELAGPDVRQVAKAFKR